MLEFGAAHCDSTESGADLKWLGKVPGLCIGAERPAGGSMERMLLQARASRKLPAAIHSVAVGVSVLCCPLAAPWGPVPTTRPAAQVAGTPAKAGPWAGPARGPMPVSLVQC